MAPGTDTITVAVSVDRDVWQLRFRVYKGLNNSAGIGSNLTFC